MTTAYLESISDACPEVIAWAKKNKIRSDSQAWSKLHRSDWMIWLAEKRGIWRELDPIKMCLFASDCAEQVLPIYEKQYPDDKRPRKAVEMARLFAQGKATQEELSAAWDAAWDAAWVAAWDAAWAAALAAASVADWDYQANRLRLYFPDPFEESK